VGLASREVVGSLGPLALGALRSELALTPPPRSARSLWTSAIRSATPPSDKRTKPETTLRLSATNWVLSRPSPWVADPRRGELGLSATFGALAAIGRAAARAVSKRRGMPSTGSNLPGQTAPEELASPLD
jgi:hypothetical protein